MLHRISKGGGLPPSLLSVAATCRERKSLELHALRASAPQSAAYPANTPFYPDKSHAADACGITKMSHHTTAILVTTLLCRAPRSVEGAWHRSAAVSQPRCRKWPPRGACRFLCGRQQALEMLRSSDSSQQICHIKQPGAPYSV